MLTFLNSLQNKKTHNYHEFLYIIPTMKQELDLENFPIYSEETRNYREAFLRKKTLEELLLVKRGEIQAEYEVLSSAFIDEKMFYLNNKKMNRYTNILAYQHSRIKFKDRPDYYINANEVKSLVDGEVFAAFGQAPVPPFNNFWEAVYYQNYQNIFMLCPMIDPRKGKQADRYWLEKNQSISLQKLQLQLVQQKALFEEELVHKVFRIKGPEGEKLVHHHTLLNWLDHKKPLEEKLQSLEYLIKLALELTKQRKKFFVHCSAGIGRTGTFASIIEGYRLFEKEKKISVFGIVNNLRKYRYHAVQTFEQYNFIYTYLKTFLKALI